MGNAAVGRIRAVSNRVSGSGADTEYARLGTMGYTGSLADRQKAYYVAASGLSASLSTADLEFRYRRALGQTGTLNDMRAANGPV